MNRNTDETIAADTTIILFFYYYFLLLPLPHQFLYLSHTLYRLLRVVQRIVPIIFSPDRVIYALSLATPLSPKITQLLRPQQTPAPSSPASRSLSRVRSIKFNGNYSRPERYLARGLAADVSVLCTRCRGAVPPPTEQLAAPPADGDSVRAREMHSFIWNVEFFSQFDHNLNKSDVCSGILNGEYRRGMFGMTCCRSRG